MRNRSWRLGTSRSIRTSFAPLGMTPMRICVRACAHAYCGRSARARSPSRARSSPSCEFSEMKLCRFRASGSEPQSRVGRVEGDKVVDCGPGESVLDPMGRPQGEYALADVTFLLPFPVADYVDF